MVSQNIRKLEFVAFDTETTGIAAAAERIVEVAAVRFSLADGPLAYFQTLINPERHIPSRVSRIHGITDAMVADAPLAADVIPQFFQFINGAVPVAHNARFDIDFMAIEAMRAGFTVPQIPVLDSCRYARRNLPGEASYSLEKLSKSLGIQASTYHRAMADSVSCLEVFRIAVQNAPGWDATWEQLLENHGPHLLFDETVAPVDALPRQLQPLVEAVQSRRTIWIEYEGSYGARSITPRSLYARSGTQYLDAVCHLDDTRKTFRVDRIAKILPRGV